MTLYYTHIQKIVEELDYILKNALVNKVKKGFGKEWILELYKDGEHYYLVIAVNPDLASIHLSAKEDCVFFDADQFTMVLRKYLNRTTLLQVEAVYQERAVRLRFKNGMSLAGHLYSRGGNLFLLDQNEHIVHTVNPCEEKIYLAPKAQFLQENEPEVCSSDKTLNQIVSEKYHDLVRERLKAYLLKKMLTQSKKNIKSLSEKIRKLKADYQKCQKHEEFFLFGSLILAYHSQNRTKGLASIQTQDYEGNELQIPLDAKKSVLENGELYFEKSRKLKNALPLIEKRMLESQQRIEKLEASVKTAQGLSLEELKQNQLLEKQIRIHKVLKKSKILHYENERGFRILVGRSSQENDEIYRMSRGKDLWFHVRDYPGSHVLIWIENKQPDEETVKDAAMLAVIYSKLKKQGEGYVMYTPRKNLSKLSGMASGQVNVSRYKSCKVKVDPARIEKLKKNGNMSE